MDRKRAWKSRPALFGALWSDAETSRPLRRATKPELADASRLWWKHRDIRERQPDEVEDLDELIRESADGGVF